jgi:deazaflavin-dependent oxidoreductase (nitroreductase family)
VLGRAIMRVAQFVHRRTGNKLAGAPLLDLTTVGARSSQPRTCTVMDFPEADDAWLIVASRSGTADHPSWYYNLAKHPDRVTIEVQGRKTTAMPQTLTGDERAAAWTRITRARPRYAGYQQKTDRQIPVVRRTAR